MSELHDRIVQTFINLVTIDSPTGEEEEIVAYLELYLQKLGLKPQSDSFGNIIVRLDGAGEPILLSAHVDTVEPGKNIRPVIENGIITSSGNTILGADNKLALATILEILHLVKENPLSHRPLEIVFTKSEEVGNFGAVNLDYSRIAAKEGYIFDTCRPIGTIIQASPYYYRFDITVKGKAAHASNPEDAVNVLPVFTHALQQIQLGRISEMLIANIGTVHAGFVRNTVPGELRVSGEVRGFIDTETKEYTQGIVHRFSESSSLFHTVSEADIVCENPGYFYKKDNAFIVRTMDIMRHKGIAPALEMSMGCSDANIFQDHGITILDLGDGSEGGHTGEEKVQISEMHRLIELIVALIG